MNPPATTVVAPNPLREGLQESRRPEPCTMVIFGASGDLTQRKLIPALYSLYRDLLLPENFAVLGFARRDFKREDFVARMREGCEKYARRQPVDSEHWDRFAEGLFYASGQFDHAEDFQKLGREFERIDEERGTRGNRIFYLATPPDLFDDILVNLGKAGLVTPAGRRGSSTKWCIRCSRSRRSTGSTITWARRRSRTSWSSGSGTASSSRCGTRSTSSTSS